MVISPADDLPDREAIAITGIGCRFPGGVRFGGGIRDVHELGELLRDGTKVFTEVPGNRWGLEFHDPGGARHGTTISHVGAFLDDIDRFDAAFFGVSPREAGLIDPQQRMLLEVCWEAMADAGITREEWTGSRTAVYTGMLAGDYATLHTKTLGVTGIGPHYASGIEASFAAGRVAYAFDLHGPAATISSACSSSLLAVHLGARSLRSGECDAALAAGVNLLITPELSVYMSGIGALSPGGSCRPFDYAADGVLRGEGCGVVVLRRLTDALADGDRVYAVLLGSAVNHDGFSLGLTAPNAGAQEDLLRSALRDAGLGPDAVDYVEAHGTGTPLGDDVELRTLAEVYGSGRDPRRPLLVGSHKAVLGHCDAAAGIAGLLKAIWVARERYVPAQPAHVAGTRSVPGVTVPAKGVSLDGIDRPVNAAVSAFGLSGTNVHLIVSAPARGAPAREAPTSGPADADRVLLLSASTPEGLTEQAARMRPFVASAIESDDPGELDDLLASAAVRRTHEAFRLAIPVGGTADLDGALADPPAGCTGFADPDQIPEPVFVYSGQGSQWPGMAHDLYESDATFRATLDECDAAIHEHADWSLVDELRRHDPSRLGDTDIAQPAIVAVQIAITRWLAERGVRPASVIGHSLGEVTAAYVAGCLTLQQAMRIVVLRGQILHETAGMGRMTAVAAPEAAVQAVLDGRPSGAVIAAVNGPASVVLAGRAGEVADAARELTERGIRCVPLPVNYAFHSPVVAGCGPRLRAALADTEPASPALRLLSSVVPSADLERPDAAYWEKNLTHPVLLWPAIDRLLDDLRPTLVEVGPHPVLGAPLADAMRARHTKGPVLHTLRRGEPGLVALLRTLGGLHVSGIRVDWERVTGRPRRYRTLPVPSWGGDRYWLPGVERGQQGESAAKVAEAAGVPAEAPDNAPESPVAEDRIAAAVRRVLGMRPDQRLPRGRGLFELGLDSRGAVELRGELESAFGIELESTVVFEHPTVEQLSARLADVEEAASSRTPRFQPAREDTRGIAVIGLACRLPGAENPEEFWSMLTEGRDAIGPLPPERGRDPAWADVGSQIPTHGGYLDDVAGFDASFFRISPREARSLDPQQRLFLEVAWEALEDAGVLSTSAGVYLGLNTADYQQLLTREIGNVDLYYGTGTSFAAAAGRLSYFLGLRGPSMAVDTACSASLTAVHLACQGLRDEECEIAIAGGTNAIVAPTVAASMSAGGALAADGRCKTFDDAADGYGRGEGAAAFVLKPLGAALRDGDRVYAVISGSAVNSDGASGGLTVPSAAAQTAVITQALIRAGWAPGDVDYVEAHGTGTALGDPIEIRALAQALGQGREAPLMTGSVKPNIGHLEAAAGAAGLLKVILALHHGELPPHLLRRRSSRIDWRNLPIQVVTHRQAWPAEDRPARAGVSAFGFSGSNAHVLVEQAPARRPNVHPAAPMSLVVTAATATALRAAAARMSARLRSAAPEELAAIANTTVHRRRWLDHRLAVDLAGVTTAEIADALDAAAAGGIHPRIRTGVVSDETPDPFAAERETAVDHAWSPVSLPAYPWERHRHWYRDDPESRDDAESRDDPEPCDDAESRDDRFFRVDWLPAKSPPDAHQESATWAVIGSSSLAAGLAGELQRVGHTVVRHQPTCPGEGWREWLTELATRGRPGPAGRADTACRGVIFVPDPDVAELHDQVLDAVTIGQAMAALPHAPGRLWFVTSRAHDPVGDTTVNPVHTAVWETGRVLAMEMPSRWGGMIDAGGANGDDDAGQIVGALHAGGLDDQLCVRDGSWYAARLVADVDTTPRRAQVNPDRWHVVLGDASAAPAVAALCGAGARRLLLVGDVPAPGDRGVRGEGPPWVGERGVRGEGSPWVGDRAGDCEVTWRRCAPGGLSGTLTGLGPLGDVVAVAEPTPTKGLAALTGQEVTGGLDTVVLLAKALGTIAEHEPQRLTVVTSAAPGWGSVNTAGSAGMAGWLTGWAREAGRCWLAGETQRTAMPTSVLALMPREDSGELTDAHHTLFEQSGLRLLTTADAADLIRRALLAEPGARSAAMVDLRRYVRICQDLAPRAFLGSIAAAEPAEPPDTELRERLLALPGALPGHVCEVVAGALGMPAEKLDPERGFFDLGMDSVMALAVRTRLEDDLGLELPSTLTFEYSTAVDLAHYLRNQLAPDDAVTDVLTEEIEAAKQLLAGHRDEVS